MIRKRIVFYGWVQGVGFRYRALHAADLIGATGWVRNEFDGYEPAEPMFNIYHISPHETQNPDEFVTEICYPVKKK